MADAAAKALGAETGASLHCFSGVIGQPLAIDKVEAGIKQAASKSLSIDGGEDAARAIWTTDTEKERARCRNPNISGSRWEDRRHRQRGGDDPA